MDAKARVGAGGLGCEPASAASVAGAKRLREEGVIAPSDRVVCILTGHQLKDPTATVAYHSSDQDQFDKVLGVARGPPGGVCESAGRGRQRPGRHHPHDRPLFRDRSGALAQPHLLLKVERTSIGERCNPLGRHPRRLGPDGHAADSTHRHGSGAGAGCCSSVPGHSQLGLDAGSLSGVSPLGVALDSTLPLDRDVGVMIDFSLPEGTLAVARCCVERKIPLVVGTTGFDAGQRSKLEGSADRIPILIAPNMSRAVNLLMHLVRDAARTLGEGADIAIIERHHRTKKDAPSGTALRLADFARQGLAARGATKFRQLMLASVCTRCESPTRPASIRLSSPCQARPSSSVTELSTGMALPGAA